MGVTLYMLFFILISVCGLPDALGQGAMRVPPGRSVMWAHLGNAAYASQIRPNYDFAWNLDCGGILTSESNFAERCGACGDAVTSVRSNEAPNGEFAIGKIVWLYHEGEKINVTIDVRSFMKGGTNTFKLCKTNSTTIVNHACFVYSLTFGDTSQTVIESVKPFPTSIGEQFVTYSLKLPPGLTCDFCVLQWIWRDNEIRCNEVTKICAPGEGDQETVVNCADVTILPQGSVFPSNFDWPRYDEYASIHAANEGDYIGTTVSSLTTGKAADTTTTSQISASTQQVIKTPSPSTPAPPSTIIMTTTATATTISTASEDTTEFPPLIIITPLNSETTTKMSTTASSDGQRTTAPDSTTTTMPILITPRLVDPLVPVAAIAAVSAGSTVSRNRKPLFGIFLLLLAIFAASETNPTIYRPLPPVQGPKTMIPQWYYQMIVDYKEPLIWYGQSYTGHENTYSPYGNKNTAFGKRYLGYGQTQKRKGYGSSHVNSIRQSQRRNQWIRQPNTRYPVSNNGRFDQRKRNSYNTRRHQPGKRFPQYNGVSLRERIIPEFDDVPPTKVERQTINQTAGKQLQTCTCNARFEVFTIYCLHYINDRIGCERESDVCFCKHILTSQ